MSSGLLYTTRSLGGREGKNIIHHMKVIETRSSNVTLLTGAKTTAGKKLIEQHGNMKIDDQMTVIGEFYRTEAVKMADWMEVYKEMDVSVFNDYTDLYLIGGLDLWRLNLTRTGSRINKFPHDRGQLKFQSVGIHCCHILALLKAHREYDIPLHELAFDPNEMSVDLFHGDVEVGNNYHLYHGYNIPRYNINRLDSLQYYMNSLNSVNELEKCYDFTFGYSVLEKSGRERYISYVNDLSRNAKTSNVYVKNAITSEDTTIDRDRYLGKIKESRYTLMLPSYDNHCFSGYRFIEAITNDCLPLIHPDCNLQDIQETFNIDLSPLVITHFPDESWRQDMLDKIKPNVVTFEQGFLHDN